MGLFGQLFGGEPVTERKPRTPEQQRGIEERCRGLSLYHYEGCPFCIRVRNIMRQMALPIEERNIHQSREYAEELYQQGGIYQVPCLRIESGENRVEWLYESNDIIAWLRREFPE